MVGSVYLRRAAEVQTAVISLMVSFHSCRDDGFQTTEASPVNAGMSASDEEEEAQDGQAVAAEAEASSRASVELLSS